MAKGAPKITVSMRKVPVEGAANANNSQMQYANTQAPAVKRCVSLLELGFTFLCNPAFLSAYKGVKGVIGCLLRHMLLQMLFSASTGVPLDFSLYFWLEGCLIGYLHHAGFFTSANFMPTIPSYAHTHTLTYLSKPVYCFFCFFQTILRILNFLCLFPLG